MVDLEECDEEDVTWLEELLERHRTETGSAVAERRAGSAGPAPRSASPR